MLSLELTSSRKKYIYRYMEEHDIADVIEYQEIYQLCKNDSRYIEFLEMLKKLVNKILNAKPAECPTRDDDSD